ncbi:hypothetical protein B0T10DRAFT_528593 [Thelonectria olida]|uniref:C3H1-type domain-containing protein n=1 Tax=Thelonectria olida TaxID=1576542 RepID=A0A9P8W6F2_9HYPO|nr:hypothetical protein B0T10DRAFT_528593 [Thelonectria olida]
MSAHFAGDFAARMAEFQAADERRIEWMKFKDEYYKAPDGGRKAALEIRTQVKDYLDKEKPDLACLPIIVKAFANEDGLSQLLVKAGIIRTSQGLLGFTKDFSQACETADFVLVGSGKDRADKKINSVFRQFVNNPTCRHVIFGACHDNTYVRLLEDYATDASIAERVTLLHGFQVGREFGDLQFKSMKMPALFRDKPVKGGEPFDSAARQSVSESKPESNFVNSTWAAAIGAKPDGEATSSKMVKEAVRVNQAGQRVDEDLPEPPQQAVESWRHKTKVANMRYCRSHHLSGACAGGCNYSHGPLTDGEKLVYRRQLRAEVCHAGLQCRDAACVYGHNCLCSKPRCKFPAEMHRVSSS